MTEEELNEFEELPPDAKKILAIIDRILPPEDELRKESPSTEEIVLARVMSILFGMFRMFAQTRLSKFGECMFYKKGVCVAFHIPQKEANRYKHLLKIKDGKILLDDRWICGICPMYVSRRALQYLKLDRDDTSASETS